VQAYDVKRKRVVNIERIDKDGAIVAYSILGEPGNWYFPLIVDGKNVEPYQILDLEQLEMST
jgi:hypothetical protein